MRMRHFLTVAAMLAATAACKPETTAASATAPGDVVGGAASSNAASRADGSSPDARAAAAPGGAFARKPGFQLPVPVSSMPASANSIPPARQADPAEIRTALLEGMEKEGANIQVQVSPQGIVSLSGEVSTIAELQRAHYLARAQPGVVEVDYRQLRVRQR